MGAALIDNLTVVSGGLYYKNVMVVTDASRVVSEWHHNLEQGSRVVNNDPWGIIYTHLCCYSTGVTFDDRQLTSVIFLQWWDMVSLPLLHQTQELELDQAYTINII